MNGKNKIVTILAAISLLAIGGIYVTGQIKNRQQSPFTNLDSNKILGQTIESLSGSNAYNGIKNNVQNTLNETKETISQKVIDTEKTVLESINKQLTDLTKSQVEAVKIQICRDLGVLPSVTRSP